MGTDEYLRHINHRQTGVLSILPSIPQLSADERQWVDALAILNPLLTLPVGQTYLGIRWNSRPGVAVACPGIGCRLGGKRV